MSNVIDCKANYIVMRQMLVGGVYLEGGDALPGDSPLRGQPRKMEQFLRNSYITPGVGKPITTSRVKRPALVLQNIEGFVPPTVQEDVPLSATGVTVVTLSYYKDIFERLRMSLETHEPEVRKVIVTSGDQDGAEYENWLAVPGDVPFSFPSAANIGILAAGRDDVLLVNDDCEFTEPMVGILQGLCKQNPSIGLLSPQVDGDVGNHLQSARLPITSPLTFSKQRLCFVCMYFPRTTIDRVGMLDEQFSGYGCDDSDYCMRVQRAGLQLAVTPLVRVKHGGFGELKCSSTFLRNMTTDEWKVSSLQMQDLLQRKWGGKAS
jgi:hypothetical protein